MSAFWSGWIMFLVVFNLGITLFLFLWGLRVRIPVLPDGTSGHVWAHGVLREGVRRLPLWWVLMSIGLFVAGITYLVLYPGFGAYQGRLGWTAHEQLEREVAENSARLQPLLQRFGGQEIETLAGDPVATRMGERLFIDNCSACHGREGHGNHVLGAPNLVDGDSLYGNDGASLLTSILDGRHGTMPPLGASLDATAIGDLANHVLQLAGADHSPARAKAGAAQFALCAACHGVDAKGNPALGAPNLTDDVWLYGSELATIERTIREGRSGVMPAWRGRLGETDARLIAAWIHARTHDSRR